MAPIGPNVRKIVDCGSGSGAWAVAVAEKFPDAVVHGIDLSPIQPEYAPDNCDFFVDDLTDGGLDRYHDGSVDLVHSRMVILGVKEHEWPLYVSNAFRILKPGTGWAQFSECADLVTLMEGRVPPDGALQQFFNIANGYFQRNNILTGRGPFMKLLFEAAGFVDVKIITVNLDLGDWRGNKRTAAAGRAWLNVYLDGIEAFMMKAGGFLDDAQRKQYMKKIVEEFIEYPTSSPLYVVIGRKSEIILDLDGK